MEKVVEDAIKNAFNTGYAQTIEHIEKYGLDFVKGMEKERVKNLR